MRVVEISVDQFDAVYIAEKLNDSKVKMSRIVYCRGRIIGFYFLIYRDGVKIEYYKVDGIEDINKMIKIDNEELVASIIREIYELMFYHNDIYICLNDLVRSSVIEYCRKNDYEYIDGRI